MADLCEDRVATELSLDPAGVVLCRSGTDAFIGLLVATGVAPGDEVILPVSICNSMINAVLLLDAVPVITDCDDRFALSPEAMVANLTTATRAVVVHHPFGLAVDLAAYREHLSADIALIEDGAQATGAFLAGCPVGSAGDAALFSFGPGKPLDAGGGGLASGTSPGLRLALHTRQPSHRAVRLAPTLGDWRRAHLLARLACFDGELTDRREKVARVTGLDPADRTNVFCRLVLATSDQDRAVAKLHARPDLAHVWQIPRATPLLGDTTARGRLQALGREELCGPRSLPGWDAVAASHLLLRTGAEVTAGELSEVVEIVAG